MAVKQLSNMLENCEKIVAELEEVPDSDLNMIDRKMKRFASNAIDEITLIAQSVARINHRITL